MGNWDEFKAIHITTIDLTKLICSVATTSNSSSSNHLMYLKEAIESGVDVFVTDINRISKKMAIHPDNGQLYIPE